MRRGTAILAATLMLAAAPALSATPSAQRDAAAGDIAAMVPLLVGRMTSDEQAKADPAYGRVLTAHVRLHPGDPDWSHAWLYGESAYAETPDKPYRQTVFQLVPQENGAVHGYQYRLREPARFAGAALRGEAPAIATDDLIPLPGCTVVWSRTGETEFKGAMRKEECRNKFRGAAWLDSSTTLSEEALVTWDRGMAADGKQVWGPSKGGYVFKRSAP